VRIALQDDDERALPHTEDLGDLGRRRLCYNALGPFAEEDATIMAFEIERKFLLRGGEWRNDSPEGS
jgi:hypothetical protein